MDIKKDYRKGAVGAMMDEYERATADLVLLIEHSSEADYTRVLDSETRDEDCRSMQTIIAHVVRAGYGYANYIRSVFSINSTSPPDGLVPRDEAFARIEKMLVYTTETLSGRWEMSDEEMDEIKIDTKWGMTYNLEQLLEHAIVHILRHRRQIERLKQQNEMS
jgi:uncharacterized damage-inducible protein DinB